MIINGQKIASKKEHLLKKKIDALIKIKKTKPVLISLVAKEDIPGLLYTKLKHQAALRTGIKFRSFYFSLKDPTTLPTLINQIIKKYKFDGLMIQKPGQELAKKFFKTKKLFAIWWLTNTSKIPERKDVDCLNVANLGLLSAGLIQFYPATVKAIYEILLSISGKQKLEGKLILIVGSSEILGKPLAMLLRNKGATIIMAGSATKDLKALTKKADIIISGVGHPNLITADMVNKGTIVIDAGIAKIGKKVMGDVDFVGVSQKASYITPVPGGVGPLTVISLMENVYKAYKNFYSRHL